MELFFKTWCVYVMISNVQMLNHLCSLINCSMPGFPVFLCLPQFAQTLGHWVSDAIQPSHLLLAPFFSCPWSSPSPGSFPMSQLLASGGQSIRASALASILPMNIQDWFPLGLAGLISSLSKGLSRVFSNTTVQKHQYFGAQPSSWSTFQIVPDYWKSHSFDYIDFYWQNDVSAL